MDTSLKFITDYLTLILTKFVPTDDSRLDYTFIENAIDFTRADLIRQQFRVTGIIDQVWMQDLGMVPFHRVNQADDASITGCPCVVSKAFIPQFVSLEMGNGNQDLGLNVLSSCGKTKYYPYALSLWRDIPAENERSLFPYYARLNDALYVNRQIDDLRLYGVLLHPFDAKIISSQPVASIANGTDYIVKYGQVIYDGVTYQSNNTFTGTATTTFGGNGKVYLVNQAVDFSDIDKYPVSGEMARQIAIEIAVKEFGIERQSIPDIKNDSRDDALKT